MCGRFTLSASATDLMRQFDLSDLPTWRPRYNIAPTQDILTVVQMPDAPERQALLLRWGLVPPWAEGPAVGSRIINARAETVATKPAFRRAFKERRCLLLADGFYEWQRQERRKQPFYIRLCDGQPFAFASLWERWVPQDGQPIDSCTIITTVANDLILVGKPPALPGRLPKFDGSGIMQFAQCARDPNAATGRSPSDPAAITPL